MIVGAHVFLQVLLEVRVGVGADHSAAGRVELKVRPGSAADLQDGERPVGAAELRQAAEQLLLLVVHFLVVRHRDPVDAEREHALVQLPQTDCVQQVKRETQRVHGPITTSYYHGHFGGERPQRRRTAADCSV